MDINCRLESLNDQSPKYISSEVRHISARQSRVIPNKNILGL